MAPRARLLGTVYTATIRPMQHTAAVYDELAGEYLAGTPRADALEVCLQLDWIRDQSRQSSGGGDTIPIRVDFVALAREVKAAGWNPRAGDVITSITNRRSGEVRAVQLYLQEAHLSGHSRAGAELVIGTLEDRGGRQTSTPEGLFG